ncbi:hypothetical protein M0655_12715 [Gordonia amicalis]|uniref:hypothetical protein n=1 Tax=Gordonia amicalis TaxID=89053 RepID=UPI0013ADDF26|nr:hypothetical protein [Gordonia amicalis]KAF0968139.1 hypothetical protein BPODLACK_03340 [Gordonia sp. YY1]UPW12254.1 hypothetical protein M0655_12715 [Gordonia amicalis]
MKRRHAGAPRHRSNRRPHDNAIAVTDQFKNALICAPSWTAFLVGLYFGDLLTS